jgi:hypothetical protein
MGRRKRSSKASSSSFSFNLLVVVLLLLFGAKWRQKRLLLPPSLVRDFWRYFISTPEGGREATVKRGDDDDAGRRGRRL